MIHKLSRNSGAAASSEAGSIDRPFKLLAQQRFGNERIVRLVNQPFLSTLRLKPCCNYSAQLK
jgi:hypothetical protein